MKVAIGHVAPEIASWKWSCPLYSSLRAGTCHWWWIIRCQKDSRVLTAGIEHHQVIQGNRINYLVVWCIKTPDTIQQSWHALVLLQSWRIHGSVVILGRIHTKFTSFLMMRVIFNKSYDMSFYFFLNVLGISTTAYNEMLYIGVKLGAEKGTKEDAICVKAWVLL